MYKAKNTVINQSINNEICMNHFFNKCSIWFLVTYTPTKKYSGSRLFFEANFNGFWQFSQKVFKIQRSHIPHWKALIFSF